VAKASFRLTGFLGLQDKLARLPKSAFIEVGIACHQTALAVQRRARQLAPKDKGDLMRAIQVAGRSANWRVGLVDEDVLSRGGRNTAHRNPSVYGVWYELGFTTRKILKHSFMGPAAAAEEGPHEDRLRAAASGIERVMAA
jgi:hypothetical protein